MKVFHLTYLVSSRIRSFQGAERIGLSGDECGAHTFTGPGRVIPQQKSVRGCLRHEPCGGGSLIWLVSYEGHSRVSFIIIILFFTRIFFIFSNNWAYSDISWPSDAITAQKLWCLFSLRRAAPSGLSGVFPGDKKPLQKCLLNVLDMQLSHRVPNKKPYPLFQA